MRYTTDGYPGKICVFFSQEEKKSANLATLFCINRRGVKCCQIWEHLFISGLALWNCKWLGKVQRVKSQVWSHQGKGNWLKCRLDWNSLQRAKTFLLSSSCCPLSPSARFSLLESSRPVLLQSHFWTTTSSSHYFSIPLHPGNQLPAAFFAWYRLFGRDTASPFLLPLSEISHFVLLAVFMTPIYFATKVHTLGIVTLTHRVQSETTPRDDSCPEYLPFCQPASQPVLAEVKMGQKKTPLQGPWGFHMLTFFGLAACPALPHGSSRGSISIPRVPERWGRRAAELMAHPGSSPRPGEPLETQAQLSLIISFMFSLSLCHYASALKPSFVSAW